LQSSPYSWMDRLMIDLMVEKLRLTELVVSPFFSYTTTQFVVFQVLR